MAQTKPKAGQFYGVSNNGTDGEFLQTDGTGGMAWASTIVDPTITSIDYPGTQTAADPAGGESVIINGTLFASGITCTVGGTSAVTAFNSATQITITTPAKAAGPYTVAVLNPDGGTASQANFIQYSGVPVWSTAAGTLGNVQEGGAASFQVTATEGSDTIEYAVTTGTLPTGLSLATATGAITGTAPAVSANTTTTFSITATDDENQTSASRSFSITVQNDAPSNHFNTVLYTGNSGTQSITGLNFEPGLVWIKRRSATEDHAWFDIVRGTQQQLSSNLTSADYTTTNAVSSFNSDGFTTGGNGATNSSGQTYVAWNFKAGGAAVANDDGNVTSQVSVNNTLGFSIVSFSNNNSFTNTFGHGLGAQPELVIIRPTSQVSNWFVYADSLGKSKRLKLNASLAADSWSSNDGWNTPTGITSSVLSFAYSGTSYPFIAYCFTSKPGFSKVGTYTGNNVTNNIQTGFEPAFLLIKNTTSTNNWIIVDNKRSPVNQRKQVLEPNTNDAESTETVNVNFLANGFQLTNGNSDVNDSGATYIYLAFAADGSTATPSLANSFATELYTGSGTTQSITTGFAPNLVWIKIRNAVDNNFLADSVRGANKLLQSNNTAGETTTTGGAIASFDTNGFTLQATPPNYGINLSPYNFVAWSFKADGTPSINTDGTITSIVSANEAAGFSVITYNGATNATADASNNGGAYWSVAHGLGAAPDLVFVKKTNGAGGWYVGGAALGSTGVNGNHLVLDSTAAQVGEANILWGGSQTFNATTFGLGAWDVVNRNGDSYVAYCFTSISGYSKVGTYTGNGTLGHSIATGFAPGFVIIKMTSASASWYMFDNKRTTGVYSDQLIANSNGAEATGTYVELTSTGFTLATTAGDLNNNNQTYIYLAIKEN